MTERKDRLPRAVMYENVTISSGQTTSTALDCGGCNLVGIIFPAAFTGATVSFEGSVDGTNFYTMKNDTGSTLSLTASTSSFVAIVPSDFAAAGHLKIVSASSEGADRTITLVYRVL
jgi:hypothetical protein